MVMEVEVKRAPQIHRQKQTANIMQQKEMSGQVYQKF